MAELTPETLRTLYLEERLTETQIADRFGTYQVRVNRLRRKWGIPTLSKTERVSDTLPELAPRQKDLVIGSLLGDGWLAASSQEAVRFSEGHAWSQRDYTDWKADLLEPFTSKRYPTTKTDRQTGKTHRCWYFATRSCAQFRPLYDLFYPTPERKRRFPANLHTLMTPFVLAVWYMDDGNCSRRNEPRITFGLDELSLRRALRALRTLGLKPKVYEDGSCQGIHFPKQRVRFRELIESHVPECMAYKLPGETPRQENDRLARRLTPEKAASLSAAGVGSITIAEMYGVGTSTVRRRLRAAGVGPQRPGPRPKGLTVGAATEILEARYPDTKVWGTRGADEQDAWMADVLATLRQVPFPYPECPSGEVRDRQMQLLQKRGAELGCATAGLPLCYPFFPNRYQARYRGQPSAYEAWHDDAALRRAIKWQFKVGDPVTPFRVLRAVTANARTPTVFRPAVARALCLRYCPVGGTTWDPCAGFGGRLVGAASAGIRYIGTDVAPETVGGNRKLAHWLGAAEQVEMRQADATTFKSPPVDLVFTSPPYFRQEQYVGGEQSWQYATYADWLAYFLRPLVKRGVEALRAGGYWVMNIADVKDGKTVYPLVEAAKGAFALCGLEEVETLRMPLSNLNRRTEGEPILVWRKGR